MQLADITAPEPAAAVSDTAAGADAGTGTVEIVSLVTLAVSLATELLPPRELETVPPAQLTA